MRALESSPVHCLNLWPSGNLRKPAKGAAAAILDNKIINTTADLFLNKKPTVYLYHLRSPLHVFFHELRRGILPPTSQDDL